MIELQNIDFQYPNSDFRLKISRLTFESGTKTAIIGPSGFGKTTLLNLISGITLPQQGSVLVFEKEVNTIPDSERRIFRLIQIGFVFQDFKLLDYLDVKENILLPYRINPGVKLDAKARNRAQELAAQLSIEDKLAKYPNKLSQGEKQRVAICRALVHDPPILLADEPTGNLDPENKQKIMQIIFDYVAERKASLIAVTHDHELLKQFDRTVDFKDFH